MKLCLLHCQNRNWSEDIVEWSFWKSKTWNVICVYVPVLEFYNSFDFDMFSSVQFGFIHGKLLRLRSTFEFTRLYPKTYMYHAIQLAFNVSMLSLVDFFFSSVRSFCLFTIHLFPLNAEEEETHWIESPIA